MIQDILKDREYPVFFPALKNYFLYNHKKYDIIGNKMNLLKLRLKAREKGLFILQKEKRFVLTNNATPKNLVSVECKNLRKVKRELKKMKVEKL